VLVSIVLPIRLDWRLKQSIIRLCEFIDRESIDAEVIICGEIIPGQVFQNTIYIPIIPAQKGECVRQGILHCKGEVVVVCDADIPVDNESLKKIITAVGESDVVFGHRFLKESTVVKAPQFTEEF
jgi:hypothetical protein